MSNETDEKQDYNGSNNNSDDDKLSFETALEKLESYVRTLEQGELTLDQSLSIFEDGMKLAKFCSKKLDEAEQKIEILVENDGELVKEDFQVEEEKND